MRRLLFLSILLSFSVLSASEGDSSILQGPLPANEYGTVIILGDEVRRQDDSTSVVVDWSGSESAKPGPYSYCEDEVIFKRALVTDGYEKGMWKDLVMKIKYHKDAPVPTGCVLLVPGGGFQVADPDSLQIAQRCIAGSGYAVAAFSYRVIGEGLYSDAAEDVNDAVSFIRENAEKYNIDSGHLALLGNSAGGYLAALAGTSQDNKAFSATGSPVKAVIDLYGLSDLTQVAADYSEETQAAYHDLKGATTQYVNGVFTDKTIYETPESAKASNPITYIDGNEMPFLIMHGSEDVVVSPSETLLLHNALLAAGVDSTRYVLEGEGHGTNGFDSEEALSVMLSFLRKTI